MNYWCSGTFQRVQLQIFGGGEHGSSLEDRLPAALWTDERRRRQWVSSHCSLSLHVSCLWLSLPIFFWTLRLSFSLIFNFDSIASLHRHLLLLPHERNDPVPASYHLHHNHHYLCIHLSTVHLGSISNKWPLKHLTSFPKCPSQYLTDRGDAFKCLSLSECKDIQFSVSV